MNVIQASFRYPLFDRDEPGLLDHVTDSLRRAFYDALDKHLAETPGGVILSPVRVEQKQETDWLFDTGESVVFRMSATCEDLPVPPEYRLIGGPADGRLVRTNGQRQWLVPFYADVPSFASYADPVKEPPKLIAEYERQGDTSAYFFKRTYEQ